MQQNTLDGMSGNISSNVSPNLIESTSKGDNWSRSNHDNLQELKKRILSQGFGIDNLSKIPFLPTLPPYGIHRTNQYPIVPPALPFDAFSAYIAQMTATANALHDPNAVAAAMATQIKKENSITPPPQQQSMNNRLSDDGEYFFFLFIHCFYL